MSKKQTRTQRTPKGHEIPIPTKDEFLDNLKKASKPKKESKAHDSKK